MGERKKDRGWGVGVRERFLDALAASCNVQQSAEGVGRTGPSAYALRRRDPGFGAAWNAALEIGYDRLQEMLVARSLRQLAGEHAARSPADSAARPARPGAGKPPVELDDSGVGLALLLLNRHQATVEGRGKPMMTMRRATREETNAAILKKLDAIARRKA